MNRPSRHERPEAAQLNVYKELNEKICRMSPKTREASVVGAYVTLSLFLPEMVMKTLYLIGAGVASLGFLSGCASTPDGAVATAALAARSDSRVSGNVSFSETASGLKIWGKIAGLTPGAHGFHIHETGDCSAPDAMSAKGHFNPSTKTHGHHGDQEHHSGDMPNLMADAQGNATYSFELTGLSLSGPNGVLGRSVVVHADPDDYKSQPAGNSGKRIACGVITSR